MKEKEEESTGTALATVSSEKPGVKAGGGKSKQKWKPRSECWNCGGKGHKKLNCPSSKKEKKDDDNEKKESKSKDSQLSSSKSGKSSGSGSGSKDTSKSGGGGASAVDEDVKGVWAVIDENFHVYDEVNEIDEDDDLPTEIAVDNDLDVNTALSASVIEEEVEVSKTAHAYASIVPSGECVWDLYDSGASHHMSPCQEDFVSFQDIAPKALMAANKESFTAHGIGDVIISVPKGDTANRMRLTRVLFTPAIGFTLISIG